MKFMVLFSLITLVSCAQKQRSSVVFDPGIVAFDSIAEGKVNARATKKEEDLHVCFDITLVVKGAKADYYSSSSNWLVAWVDENQRYRLLKMRSRGPASFANETPEQWTSHFEACADHIALEDVKALVLSPNELPYEHHKSLELNWN